MIKKPFLLGLTGSIGMGKSTTAQMFADEGIPVWDADKCVAQLYEKHGAAVDLIHEIAPDAVKNNAVDRKILKTLISDNPEFLHRIEQIVHPLVAKSRQEFVQTHASEPLIVLDIPLLFETGGDARVDAVLVVSAPESVQHARVLARETMDEATFRMILAKQMPDEEKRKRADYIISTVSIEATRTDVQDLIRQLKAK